MAIFRTRRKGKKRPDALLRIEHGCLGHQTLHPHAAIEGVDGDLTNLSSAMRLPEGLDLLLSCRDLLRHSGAQIRGVDRVAGAEARICHSGHQLLRGELLRRTCIQNF